MFKMILLLGLCLLLESSTGAHMDDNELAVLYSDCSKYELDLFGGPVCGTDGTTYRNPVQLACLNHHNTKKGQREVGISSHGSCPGDMDGTGCPWNPIYHPVCGSDGKTYSNKEWLTCLNNKTHEQVVDVEKEGRCEEKDPCTSESRRGPKVCASNGLTYHNAEAVRCLRKHQADYNGPLLEVTSVTTTHCP